MGRFVVLAWLWVGCSAGGGGDPRLPDGGAGIDARPPDTGAIECRSDAECGDGVFCSIDSCLDGACVHEPCLDCCEGELVCDATLGCVTAPEPCETNEDCVDTVRCTLDACREGACRHSPEDGLCDAGEICLAAVGCITEPPTSCETAADCEVGAHCVGEWRCSAEFGCSFFSLRDCADEDPCTIDACVEERGGCVHDIPPEICGDGIDQNCDGMIDEGCCTVGPCTTTCGSAGTVECPSGVCVPPEETCNGTDDDCDGMTDEGCCTVGPCTTTCGSAGIVECPSGACLPPAETCNGADDDCDAMIDDGFTCRPGEDSLCPTSCGTTGMRSCTAGCTWDVCRPPPETCNGSDDDCDTRVDEGFTCVAGSSGSCPTSCGSTGTRDCTPGCTWDVCRPPPETCNGGDDDCDGSRDEGFACTASTTSACTTSCGSAGSQMCSATCTTGACAPPPETCNGTDDDCDTLRDEGFACVAGTTGSCTTGCSSTGTRTCTGGCTWDTCVPPPEICNGVDDDCDGARDEMLPCIAGTTGSCTTTCGSTGTQVCSATCTLGACTPPAEACNGRDDDCDGMSDEGFPCRAGTSSSCTTSCGTTGTRACLAGCVPDATCVPPAETCNGTDDDCDGTCDEPGVCCRGRTVACSSLGMGFTTGTATCRMDCGGYDTSGCSTMMTWNPTGTYTVTPGVSYSCAFGLTGFTLSPMTFSDNGSMLTVTYDSIYCPTLTGGSAQNPTRSFDVSCVAGGTCTERYRLMGMFSDDDNWSGTFCVTYTPSGGSCYDCDDVNPRCWTVMGRR